MAEPTLHDWSGCDPGSFHQFHNAWIAGICRVLNNGGLPDGFDAYGERVVGPGGPDVLITEPPTPAQPQAGGVGLLEATATHTAVDEAEQYVRRQDRLVIRGGDREVIAVTEIVSRGNKDSHARFGRLLEKAVAVIDAGAHLSIVDVHRPRSYDPRGMVDAVWEELTGQTTGLAGRSAGTVRNDGTLSLFAEEMAVGSAIPSVPLFLTPGLHVPLPLAEGYADAWQTMPKSERAEIEAAG